MSAGTKSSAKSIHESEGIIPNRNLFAYAAGIAGQNMNYGFINGWLFYFCNNVLKISADAVGLITGISGLWDSINDPIIGALIDRHTFKNQAKSFVLILFICLQSSVLSVC